MPDDHLTLTAWLPDFIYTGGRFESGLALVADGSGRITQLARDPERLAARVVRLRGRALLPGLVNAHSHAFQRVIRGRTERRSAAHDSFWTWREMMYASATRLSPEDVYDASRMAFLEMAASGITAVGEFHYLHRALGGAPYADENELARQVVRAAADVGIRIALLRVAYARAGWRKSPDRRQARFIEPDPEAFLRQTEQLRSDLARAARANAGARPETATAAAENAKDAENAPVAWVGVAPHSVRAVPLDYLRAVCAYAAAHRLPVHMHVAEQPAEVAACTEEHGRAPVALLAHEGLLSERFTAVHAVHITPADARSLARARAHVCACPTTERNLGDGIVPADLLIGAGVRISLGTDSHTQIDLLEDARELEYHLRLQKLERAVLAPEANVEASGLRANNVANDEANSGANSGANGGANNDASDGANGLDALAARLFNCATANGAAAIGANGGALEAGRPADFFTVALDDSSIAGAGTDDLLPAIVFSLARTAMRDTYVGGRCILEDGRHPAQDEIIGRFTNLQRRLWRDGGGSRNNST
ncbi:MAG TPA: formimidoylglutamate deiminase [Pyrinomonadaceae bacterium]|nr:formimidoylglutamate deiminase [Pyrinomonadaceae bacterium]